MNHANAHLNMSDFYRDDISFEIAKHEIITFEYRNVLLIRYKGTALFVDLRIVFV